MQIQHTHNRCSGYITAIILAAILLLLFIAAAESHENRSGKVVQQIGTLRSNLAEAIGEQVKIIPFSKKINARRTPIIYQGGLFIKENGQAGGLRKAERKAIKKAYRNGKTIVILDASVHDVEALHVLLGEGVVHDSDTDPVKAAYTLRKVNQIPTARVVTYARLAPLEIQIYADDDDYDDDSEYEYVDDSDSARTFALAVDMVVNDLFPPADTVTVEDQPCGGSGEAACWTDTPLQQTIMSLPSSAGVFNTTANVYALHQCSSNGLDQYVVTTEGDWTATEAKFQSANSFDGTLKMDGNLLNLNWQNINATDVSKKCFAGILEVGEVVVKSICRYANYPLQYSIEIEPPATGTIKQVNAAPAASQGTGTSYSTGISISITGSVNISGDGPSGGIRAGVSWNNQVSKTIPSLLVKAGDKGNQGAFWDYVYCTGGSGTGTAGDETCVSNVQMVASGCLRDQMGQPENGQTPDGKLSAIGQSVQFEASPDTRVGDTFDIDVTFTADMATSTTNLWYGPLTNPNIVCTKYGIGPEGYCNCAGCNCGIRTDKTQVIAKHTFKIPFPSTQCTKTTDV